MDNEKNEINEQKKVSPPSLPEEKKAEKKKSPLKWIIIAAAALLLIAAVIAGFILFGNGNNKDEDSGEDSDKTKEEISADEKDDGEKSPSDGDENENEDSFKEEEDDLISYEDFESSLILSADEQNLLTAGKTADLTLFVPSDAKMKNVDIYSNRALLLTVQAKDLKKGETEDIDGVEYTAYSFELDTDDLTNSSNYIFAGIGDQGSNTVELFRPLKMSEEDVQLTYDVLCGVTDVASEILNSGEEFTTDELMLAVTDYLYHSEDVVSFDANGGMVFFTMTNGETSFVSIKEADGSFSSGETADININGPYSEKTETVQGECDPYTYFIPSQNRSENLTTVDPDVLIMAPIRSAENSKAIVFNLGAANGDAEEALGKKIAGELKGGTYDLRTDGECTAELVTQWDQYGTILLNTHGPDDGALLDNPTRENDSTYFFMGAIHNFSPIDHGMDDFLELAERWNVSTEGLEENHYYWRNSGVYRGIRIEHLNVLGVIDCNVVVTADHLMTLLADAEFENTVFLFDVCNGLSDEVFNNFLLSKGASCVWGYTESVNGETSQSLISKLDTYFLGIEAETDYSKYMTIISESQDRNTILDDINLECRRPEDGALYTYYGHTELNGTVTDELCGEPVVNVTVKLYRYYNGSFSFVKEVKTNEEGKYTFKDTPFGIYMIEGVFGEHHTFINFSIGNGHYKTVDFKVAEYIPISTFEELMAISENLSGKYFLMNDITCDSSYAPIGWDGDTFKGCIAGNGHTIFNISSPLFRSINGSKIKDLSLVTKNGVDTTVYLEDASNYGPLACAIHKSTLYNCTSSGSVSTVLPEKVGGNVGGFAGHFENSTMENCTSSVSISLQASTTTSRCGGLAGYAMDATFIGCSSTGSLSLSTGTNDSSIFSNFFLHAGGIAGSGRITLTECFNTGSIFVSGGNFIGSQAGGFLGNGSCSADRCYNSGSVTSYMPTENDLGLLESIMQGNTSVGGKEEADSLRGGIDNVNFMFWYDPPSGGYAGGFVGNGDCPSIKDCYNTGAVTGSYCAGGIVGKTYKFSATNCVNLGSVTGSFCTGGFVGYLSRDYFSTASYKSCYAIGSVGSAYICGPFAGVVDNEVMELSNCFYSSAAGIDSSLMIIAKESKHHVFSPCSGISSVVADASFDFENVWSYNEEDGSISLK